MCDAASALRPGIIQRGIAFTCPLYRGNDVIPLTARPAHLHRVLYIPASSRLPMSQRKVQAATHSQITTNKPLNHYYHVFSKRRYSIPQAAEGGPYGFFGHQGKRLQGCFRRRTAKPWCVVCLLLLFVAPLVPSKVNVLKWFRSVESSMEKSETGPSDAAISVSQPVFPSSMSSRTHALVFLLLTGRCCMSSALPAQAMLDKPY